MSFLNGGKQNRKRGKPTESAQVTENVILDLWIDESDTYYWCLSRINPKSDGRSYRTLRPSDSLDAIEGIAFLLQVLSKAPGLSDGDKVTMEKLARTLEGVVEEFKSGKPEATSGLTNGETKTSLLASHAA